MMRLRLVANELSDQNGLTYEPWALGPMIGYRVWHPDGQVRYLYFNPSDDDSEGESNVFVYYGPEGDPSADTALHHYVIPQERNQV